ncbi:unnamed protein product [Alopecurus aequalis]
MAEHQIKRPKFSKDPESSGGKKSSSVPAATVTPGPIAAIARMPKLAAASPIAMTKRTIVAVKSTATSPSAGTAPGLVAPSPKALVEPDDGGALEKSGWAVVGVPAEEKAIDGLTAKNKKWLHCAACPGALKPPISMVFLHFFGTGRRENQGVWPAPQKSKYGTEQSFVLPASSSSDQPRLLVGEDDGRVFLLALGASSSGGAAGRRPVTVVCVRGNARPVYKGTLTVEGPPDEYGDDASLTVTARVPTCPVPGEVDMEGGRLNAHVSQKMLHGHGESMKVHLSINFH